MPRSCDYTSRLKWCDAQGILNQKLTQILYEKAKQMLPAPISVLSNSSLDNNSQTDDCFIEESDHTIMNQFKIHLKSMGNDRRCLFVLALLVWLFVIIGNSVVIIGFRAQSRKKEQPYVHQISLVACDMIVMSLSVLLMIYEFFLVYHLLSCRWRRLLNHLAVQLGLPMVNQVLLIGIAYDRIQGLRDPANYRKFRHKRRALIFNLVSYSVCLAVAALFASSILQNTTPLLKAAAEVGRSGGEQKATTGGKTFVGAAKYEAELGAISIVPNELLVPEYEGPILKTLAQGAPQLNSYQENIVSFCISNLLTTNRRYELYHPARKCWDMKRNKACSYMCSGCLNLLCGYRENDIRYTLLISGFSFTMTAVLLVMGVWLVSEYRTYQCRQNLLANSSRRIRTVSNNNNNSNAGRQQNIVDNKARLLTIATAFEVLTSLIFSFLFTVHLLFDFGRQTFAPAYFTADTVESVRTLTDISLRIFGGIGMAQNFPIFIILSGSFRRELASIFRRQCIPVDKLKEKVWCRRNNPNAVTPIASLIDDGGIE